MTPLEAVGWFGQACFFSRFLVQWLVSEREKRSAAPPLFWWITLAGCAASGFYTGGRGESVLLLGYVIGAGIALRNLALSYGRDAKSLSLPWAVGGGLIAWCVALRLGLAKAGIDHTLPWLTVVIVGQAVWTSRFIVQWIATERTGTSHFPRSFWWISLVGNALLLTYTIHLGDSILIAGYLLGPVVQVRNLILDSRAKTQLAR